MAVFAIAFTLVYTLVWWLGRNVLRDFLIAPMHLSKRWLWLYDLVVIGTAIVSISYRLKFLAPSTSLTFALRLHYVAMGVTWLLALIAIVRLVFKLASKKRKIDEGRRSFLKRHIGLASIGGVVAASTVGAVQAFSPELEKVEVPLKAKYKDLSGLTIVQLSDIHIGPTLKKDFMDDLVQRANELMPDIIVITGDMVDGTVSELSKELQGLKRLSAKLGVYYITGNHEYYWNGKDWIEFVKSCGIRVFENDNDVLQYNGVEFVLGGVYDLKAQRLVAEHVCDPQEAFTNVRADIYQILLAHQPNTAMLTDGMNIDLQLSGHTHGGQGWPWNFIVGLVQPYLKGLYQRGDMQIYVNRGTGFWGPPYRLGIPGEISHITLKYA